MYMKYNMLESIKLNPPQKDSKNVIYVISFTSENRIPCAPKKKLIKYLLVISSKNYPLKM